MHEGRDRRGPGLACHPPSRHTRVDAPTGVDYPVTLRLLSAGSTPLRRRNRLVPHGEGSPVVSAVRRERRSFAKIPEVLEVPNLIALQRDSFKWFLDEGLRDTFHDISPIEDFTGTLAVEFGDHEFGDPKYTVEE